MGRTAYTWTCPVGVTKVLIECWGAGGGGHIGQFYPSVGGGGGGGAYARKAGIAVTAGVGYNVEVANTTNENNSGDMSLFSTGATCSAVGGAGAAFGSHGAGGAASSCVGDTTYSGGDGGGDPIPADADGYGGGGSGDNTGSGASGGHSAGGPALPRGGGGGAGGIYGGVFPASGHPGAPGTGPGGGGGGGSYDPVQSDGGTGAQGAVLIWNDTAGAGWPPAGSPIGSYGATVPPLNTVTTYAYITH